MKKIMLVASAGGHWVELTRLNKAVQGHHLIYVTTNREFAKQNKNQTSFVVPDASRWDRIRIVMLACRMFYIVLRIRPDVVISTGALPGFFAVFFGHKIVGAKTIWLDSIANSEKISMSGRKAGKYTDLWLTQWKHLARPEGPYYYGEVI